MKELTKIANIAQTDKGTIKGEAHSFTEFYDSYFNEIKLKSIKEGRKLNILEIGVQHGNSMHMLYEYFKDVANVYGIDINLRQNQYHNDKIHLYEFNATDKEKIDDFLGKLNNIKFDIIIDDASHISQHQIFTFLYLYKNLNKDGIYIIEDLHVGLNEKTNSPLYFLLFKDKLSFLSDSENKEIINVIDNVTIYSRHNSKGLYNQQSVTSILKLK